MCLDSVISVYGSLGFKGKYHFNKKNGSSTDETRTSTRLLCWPGGCLVVKISNSEGSEISNFLPQFNGFHP